MPKIIIANAHDLEVVEVENLSKIEMYEGEDKENNLIELENGTWIRSMGDGRYYSDDNEGERWAEVISAEYDEDGNYVQGELLGYTRV